MNSQMDHCSFLKTMQQKWGLTSLGPRQDAAPPFTEVFASSPRTDSWPDFPSYPGQSPALDATLMRHVDPNAVPVNGLQASILNAIVELYGKDPAVAALAGMRVKTAKDAQKLLERVKILRYPAR